MAAGVPADVRERLLGGPQQHDFVVGGQRAGPARRRSPRAGSPVSTRRIGRRPARRPGPGSRPRRSTGPSAPTSARASARPSRAVRSMRASRSRAAARVRAAAPHRWPGSSVRMLVKLWASVSWISRASRSRSASTPRACSVVASSARVRSSSSIRTARRSAWPMMPVMNRPEQQGQTELKQRGRQDFDDGLRGPSRACPICTIRARPAMTMIVATTARRVERICPDLWEEHEKQDVLGPAPVPELPPLTMTRP